MTLPTEDAISLTEIVNEYGVPFKTPLSEILRGSDYIYDSGPDYPNGDIPTEPPVALTDFYGGERNPDTIQMFDRIVLGDDLRSQALIIGADPKVGMFVLPHDGSGIIVDGARFKVRIELDCVPGYIEIESPDGTFNTPWYYDHANRRMQLQLGLTAANPAFSSNRTIVDNMQASVDVTYYETGEGFGYIYVLGQVTEAQVIEDPRVGTHYVDEILPGNGAPTHIQLERGSVPGGGFAKWELSFLDRDGVTIWKQSFSEREGWDNSGGWLVLHNKTWSGDSNCDLDISYIQAVAGDTALP